MEIPQKTKDLKFGTKKMNTFSTIAEVHATVGATNRDVVGEE